MKETKIIDNKADNLVYTELRDSIKSGSKLSVISGYFTMYAYYEMKEDFDKIDKMQFIFTQPSFLENRNKEVREYFINNESNIFGNPYEIKLRNEMTQGPIAKMCSEWISDKVEVKSFKSNSVATPRMINVQNENVEDNISISGSIDFTTDGLGLTPSDRPDANMCVFGEVSLGNQMLFDTFWNNDALVEDVKDELLKQLEVMYIENPAEFVYFVSMYNLFYNYLDELDEDKIVKTRTGFKDTGIWNTLYKFQKDAVYGVIDKIEKYNGCILADSVGLGKTYTALAVIKYYELRNDRVLVLVPKKLRDNWTIYTQNDKRNVFLDDRFNYDVLNHTDLSRESGKSGSIDLSMINWNNYDLVVIDESHNFRNNPPVKDHKTRYQRLMDDVIKSGVETKVLMLSATPVNNRMNDIKNQIGFITEEHDDALEAEGIKSISTTLRNAQTVFNQWNKLEPDERTSEAFVDMINMDYFKLLDTLTLARSRKHIEKYYNTSDIGKFPNRLTPKNFYPKIDETDKFPPISDINTQIEHLKLGIYTPFRYIKLDKRSDYEELYDTKVLDGKGLFKQTDREDSLTGLIKTLLLKRMESSIHAFGLTVEKLLNKINHVLNLIDNQKDLDIDLDITSIDPDGEEYDEFMFGNKNKVLLQDLDILKLKPDLIDDKKILEKMLADARDVDSAKDAKLSELKKVIVNKIENPINSHNKKILIFTAFADTAKYLYENLNEWLLDEFGLNSALVVGSGGNKTNLKHLRSKTDFNEILLNFSPKSKERGRIYPDLTDEIDILIGTDCISEGQNLQDCDYLINYDIHWNPVRIIQRFGRIDRIGSENDDIQLVNFWPNVDLDEYIDLNQRVRNKMLLVDVSATADENILSDDERNALNDLQYRKKQLEKLKTEVIDLEDISGGISITDLTFNDFKVDLMDYLKEHEDELSRAPKGIYSIVEINENLRDELNPGVIFLLRQRTGEVVSRDKNPLAPYYMVYVTEDGTVKYSYTQTKRILDYYKKLCSGEREVYDDLVDEFNMETDKGINMKKYSDLLRVAIENLIGKKREEGVQSLFSLGGTITPSSSEDILEDFELITFLILK